MEGPFCKQRETQTTEARKQEDKRGNIIQAKAL
jgi:hypothetical protein